VREADPNLYFSTSGPVTVHAPQPLACPLGEIVYAGTKWDSHATYAHAPPPDFMRPTPHYLLVYTLEGAADYVDSTGVREVLRPGTLIWTRPGVNQSYGPQPGVRWSELFMWLRGPAFDAWQEQGIPGERTRVLALEPLDYWFPRLCELVRPGPDANADSLVRLCQLQQVLAEALQIHEAGRHSADMAAWRETACRLLTKGTLTTPSLEEIAASMHVSYTLFRKRFLHLAGTTPSQYRTGEIIRRASERLLTTDDALADIAADLGFHDAFHLSRRFKQRTGMAPRDFRRQVQRKQG